jgi:hypothetical protein
MRPFGQNSALHYLRFDTGRYGQARLKELADSYAGPDQETVRRSANAVLALKTRWEPVARVDVRELISKLPIYPQGRALDPGLIDKLVDDLTKPGSDLGAGSNSIPSAGIFIDLNDDNVDEFVFMTPFRGRVYENREGKWQYRGDVFEPWRFGVAGASSAGRAGGAAGSLIDDLAKGNVTSKPSKWHDLMIGTHRYRMDAPD